MDSQGINTYWLSIPQHQRYLAITWYHAAEPQPVWSGHERPRDAAAFVAKISTGWNQYIAASGVFNRRPKPNNDPWKARGGGGPHDPIINPLEGEKQYTHIIRCSRGAVVWLSPSPTPKSPSDWSGGQPTSCGRCGGQQSDKTAQ